MNNLDDFIRFWKNMPQIIADYKRVQSLVEAQVEYRSSNKLTEDQDCIVLGWITTNTQWLIDHEPMYNKCMALQAMPATDISLLVEVYNNVCKSD